MNKRIPITLLCILISISLAYAVGEDIIIDDTGDIALNGAIPNDQDILTNYGWSYSASAHGSNYGRYDSSSAYEGNLGIQLYGHGTYIWNTEPFDVKYGIASMKTRMVNTDSGAPTSNYVSSLYLGTGELIDPDHISILDNIAILTIPGDYDFHYRVENSTGVYWDIIPGGCSHDNLDWWTYTIDLLPDNNVELKVHDGTNECSVVIDHGIYTKFSHYVTYVDKQGGGSQWAIADYDNILFVEKNVTIPEEPPIPEDNETIPEVVDNRGIINDTGDVALNGSIPLDQDNVGDYGWGYSASVHGSNYGRYDSSSAYEGNLGIQLYGHGTYIWNKDMFDVKYGTASVKTRMVNTDSGAPTTNYVSSLYLGTGELIDPDHISILDNIAILTIPGDYDFHYRVENSTGVYWDIIPGGCFHDNLDWWTYTIKLLPADQAELIVHDGTNECSVVIDHGLGINFSFYGVYVDKQGGGSQWAIADFDNLLFVEDSIETNQDEEIDVSIGNESAGGVLDITFTQGNDILAEFSYNFTDNILDLTDIAVERENGVGATKAYISVRGIEQEDTKILYLHNISPNFNWICIKDAEIDDISEITSNCKGENEYHVQCNGQEKDGYICEDIGGSYKITGLKHSAIIQADDPEEPAPPPSNSGGGGGGSRSYTPPVVVEEIECSKDWVCGSWTQCKNDKQIRECVTECGESLTDLKNCELEKEEVTDWVDYEPIQRNYIGSAVSFMNNNKFTLSGIVAFLVVISVLGFYIRKRK